MKQLVLFLALGILLIGNNFLSPIVLAETLEEEKKEQLLDSSEKIIEQLKLKVRNLEAYENWNKSKKLRERILNITKQIYGKNHVNTAIELNELALLYNKTGEYEKAKSYYKKSLEINKKILGLDHQYTATSLNNLGSLYGDLDQFEKAESLLEQSLEIRKRIFGLEHSDTATSLNNLGLLYNDFGQYEKAESLLKQSVDIYKKVLGLDHSDTARSLNNLGLIYDHLAQYEKAESLYTESLEIRKRILGLEHSDTAASLNNLGMFYISIGQYEKAESLLKQSVDIYKKVLGLDHSDTARSLNNLGFLYDQTGEYEKAKTFYKQSLKIYKKIFGLENRYTAMSLNNLGMVYVASDAFNKAKPLIEQSLEIYIKALGLDHPNTAILLNNLAFLYNKTGEYEKAKPLYKQSIEISKNILGIDHPDTVLKQGNLGNLYLSNDEYEKGNKLMRNALMSRLKFFQREVPFLPKSSRTNFINNFALSQQIYSHLSKNNTGKKIAITNALNAKGLLEEIEKRQSQLKSVEGPQKEIVKKLRIINQKVSSLKVDQNPIQEVLIEKEALEKKLYRLLPSYKPRMVNIEDLIKVMPNDSILIEYVYYYPYIKTEWQSPRYLALVLDPSKKESDDNSNLPEYKIHAIDLGSAETLENKIKEALISIEEGLSDAEQLLQDIGKSIIQPITDITKGSKTWFISPDGELNKIPFAALRGFEGNNLLVDKVEIRLLTTGRELIDLQEKNKSKSKSNISYVFANPLFDSDRKRISDTKQIKSSLEFNDVQNRSVDLSSYKWAPLPGTAREGKFIANTINARLFVEDKAAAKKIINIKNPEILHIASHSYYLKNQADNINPPKNLLITQNSIPFNYFANNENPLLRSGVVLAGANNPDLNHEDDGYLTALEITQLDWNGTELVVISGCESGQGEIRKGDGIYGLRRAISLAGAKSSLLSLWKIDDEATAFFMKSFYERLIEGEGRAEALLNTQREFRNHKNKNYRHPYFWAAFQLSGDWRPIDF